MELSSSFTTKIYDYYQDFYIVANINASTEEYSGAKKCLQKIKKEGYLKDVYSKW